MVVPSLSFGRSGGRGRDEGSVENKGVGEEGRIGSRKEELIGDNGSGAPTRPHNRVPLAQDTAKESENMK